MKESIVSKFLTIAIIGVLVTAFLSFLAMEISSTKNEKQEMIVQVQLIKDVINNIEASNIETSSIENSNVETSNIGDSSVKKQLDTLKEKFSYIGNITILPNNQTITLPNSEEDITLSTKEMEMLKDGIVVYRQKMSDKFLGRHLYAMVQGNDNEIIILDKTNYLFSNEIHGFVIAILISLLIIGGIGWRLANKFSVSLEKPLKQLAMEMTKFMENKLEFYSVKSKYKELNLIVDAAEKMADNVTKYVEKLEVEKKVRQEFFSNASHELKTPITSVKGYTELLQNGFAKDERMQADFLSRIEKETDNMTNLINDILMISKLETKEATETMAEVKISLVIQDIISALTPLANKLEVTIDSDCSNFVIEASIQQMNQLIGNLISNAIKYNKPGGIVWIRAYAETDTMVLIVEDNGMGIEEESKSRVFERFYRVDKGRNKKSGGTGLGLAIVKHIVQYYDGTITLDSTLGVGTKFTVRLPLRRSNTKS